MSESSLIGKKLPEGFWDEVERAAWDKSFRSEHARNPANDMELSEWIRCANVPRDKNGKIDVYKVLELSAFGAIKNSLLKFSEIGVQETVTELAAWHKAFHTDNGRDPGDALDFGRWMHQTDVPRNTDGRIDASKFLKSSSFNRWGFSGSEDAEMINSVRRYLEFYRKAQSQAWDKVFLAFYDGVDVYMGDIEDLLSFGVISFDSGNDIDPFGVLDDNEFAELEKK